MDSEAQKLVDLLFEYFERKGVEVDIKEFDFDFEFDFNIDNMQLSQISTILSILSELNKGVLIQYDTEVQMFWPKMTVYFDRFEFEGEDSKDDDSDEEEEF